MSAAAPLHVAGIGPGDACCLTPQARQAIVSSTCLAGYGPYLELVPPELREGKRIVATGMRREVERCEAAVAAALAGEPTCLVCSGDPGIYALAGLVLELLQAKGLLGTVPFAVVPGVPALCAAASLLGAPLTHDFACVSLSDLLTPLPKIRRRLEAALDGDFVLVLHNPRSRGRPGYLAEALDMAKMRREPDCPVGMVRNAFRAGQEAVVAPLADFDPEGADMLSIVMVGNSESRQWGNLMVTPRGYGLKREG
ncbi:MAG: precorrin-3B C(17)-methyltransferase [Desulfovibrio sp.]|jgi:precorrin-3B C17-methyltransferase|nr:precorrin-3B C(17)-methyltransferase [Desulfovibrio sp.]